MNAAFMITIFGYGAPVSDTSAIDLMKLAWGNAKIRNMEQTEVIDVKEENELRKTWAPFIHSHHYSIEKSFYSSWIANHPRRSDEAYFNQFMEAKYIENNPLPKDANFKELWLWFSKLHKIEK